MNKYAVIIVMIIIVALLFSLLRYTEPFANPEQNINYISPDFIPIGCYNKDIFKGLPYTDISIKDISNKVSNNTIFIINSITINGTIGFWTGDEKTIIDLLVNSTLSFENLDNNNNKCYRYKVKQSSTASNYSKSEYIIHDVGSPSHAPNDSQNVAIYSKNKKFINTVKNEKYKLLQNKLDTYKCPEQSCPPCSQPPIEESSTVERNVLPTEGSTKPEQNVYNFLKVKDTNGNIKRFNYEGCYTDNGDRMVKINNDTDKSVFDYLDINSCADKTLEKGGNVFGFQNSDKNGTGQCWTGNNIDRAKSLGKSDNCKPVNGYNVGSDFTNALYVLQQ